MVGKAPLQFSKYSCGNSTTRCLTGTAGSTCSQVIDDQNSGRARQRGGRGGGAGEENGCFSTQLDDQTEDVPVKVLTAVSSYKGQFCLFFLLSILAVWLPTQRHCCCLPVALPPCVILQPYCSFSVRGQRAVVVQWWVVFILCYFKAQL